MPSLFPLSPYIPHRYHLFLDCLPQAGSVFPDFPGWSSIMRLDPGVGIPLSPNNETSLSMLTTRPGPRFWDSIQFFTKLCCCGSCSVLLVYCYLLSQILLPAPPCLLFLKTGWLNPFGCEKSYVFNLPFKWRPACLRSLIKVFFCD